MAEKSVEKSSLKSVTVQGIKIKIDPAALDDWELTEIIADIQYGDSGDALKTVFLARKVLGPEYEKVKDHLKARNGGRVSNEAFSAFVKDVFQAVAPNS